MNKVVILLRSNADHWATLLQQALPTHQVLTQAGPGDGVIAYAVVGKPAPGALGA